MSQELDRDKMTEWIGKVNDAHLIVEGNYEDLENLFEYNKNLDYQEARSQLNPILTETNRRLFNYLASVKTLVDHSRDLAKKIDDKYLDKETVTSKLDEKNLSRRIVFFEKLRNYYLHRETATPSSTTLFGEPTENMKPGRNLTIKAEKFIDWCKEEGSKRHQTAKAFAEEKTENESLNIQKEVKEFQEFLNDYMSWYIEEVRDIHFAHYRE
jgi:hypothetical protein